jgi:hypothetical protein
MVLGLTVEAYAVMWCENTGNPAIVASILSGGLLVFPSFAQAKDAAPTFIDYYYSVNGVKPAYVWIQALNRLWIDGVQQ